MGKFKVGDKVRLKSIEEIRKIDKSLNGIDEEDLKEMQGKIYTIQHIPKNKERCQLFQDMKSYWFTFDFLKKVYTYSFKQLPDDYYGKLIIENGQVIEREDTWEILTESEREYLRAVIEPFREKIKYICKTESFPNDIQSIMIVFKNAKYGHMCFPDFKIGTMYKRMTAHKEYTIEELGL